MAYRMLVVIVALVLILVLLLGFWLTSRLFLSRYGWAGDRTEQINRLTAWTFAGFGLGLIFVGVGGPILGTLAFAHTARSLSGAAWPVVLRWGAIANLIIAIVVGGAFISLLLGQ